jgi:hypothetical protein
MVRERSRAVEAGDVGEAGAMGIDEKLGWWMAPDGNWYPPELQLNRNDRVGVGAVSARIRPLGPRSRFEPLHFGGSCVNCGIRIKPHEEGWNDPDIDTLLCADCWPAVVASHPSAAGRSADRGAGTARSAAPPRRTEVQCRPGTPVQDLISIGLRRHLGDRAVVLTGRRVPGGTASIDNVVVASSGVWVVDSKKLDGLIEYRTVAGSQDEDRRLLIGGHDRTALVDGVHRHIVPVAGLVDDPSVPLHGAVAMVEGNWGGPTRLLARRPHRHRGIWILWPAALIKKIEEPGPLDTRQVRSIGAALDGSLPPR